jgi:hypothetical protein
MNSTCYTLKAVLRGDYETLVKMTYRRVVDAMGGADKMIAVTRKTMSEMKEQGYQINSYSVDALTRFFTVDKATFSIVPTKIEMTAPGGKLIVSSYLIGISAEDGSSWTFVDGSGSPEDRKKLIPNLPSTLKLPEPHNQLIIKNP